MRLRQFIGLRKIYTIIVWGYEWAHSQCVYIVACQVVVLADRKMCIYVNVVAEFKILLVNISESLLSNWHLNLCM